VLIYIISTVNRQNTSNSLANPKILASQNPKKNPQNPFERLHDMLICFETSGFGSHVRQKDLGSNLDISHFGPASPLDSSKILAIYTFVD